jgi:dTDP-4-dehydrorhamnose 3,5-epimerase
VWVPPGLAHGFVVLSETAEFLYKTTEYYAPEHERCIAWNDPNINVIWPAGLTPKLSSKDEAGATLERAELFL